MCVFGRNFGVFRVVFFFIFSYLFSFCLGDKVVQLIMEYVPLGSLREFLPKHALSLSHLLLFAQQICEVSPGWGWISLKKWGYL